MLPDPHKSYLTQDELLISLGYRYHEVFNVLICIQCGYAIPPLSIAAHPRTKHGVEIADENALQALLSERYELVTPEDVTLCLPEPFGPPVEGLSIQDGYKCIHCEHAAPSAKRVSTVYFTDHPDNIVPCEQRSEKCKIQTFWPNTHRTYFAVNTSGVPTNDDSAYAAYLHQQLPQPRLGPSGEQEDTLDPRNFHPLLRMTRWHEHLIPIIDQLGTHQPLLALAASPTKEEKVLSELDGLVRYYLRKTAKEASNTPYIIRKMLHRFPL